MKERNIHLDITKGLAITLVVLGHTPIEFGLKGEAHNVIYSFHMPIFFFLSGIFFSTRKTFAEFSLTKADQLLKPFYVTLILVGFINFFKSDFDAKNYILGMLYATGDSIEWTPLWFLPHLFVVSCASYALVKLATRFNVNLIGIISIMACMFLSGIELIHFIHDAEVPAGEIRRAGNGLPFSLDLTLVTTFFFLLGYYLKTLVLPFKPNYLILSISLIVFGFLHIAFDNSMDLDQRYYSGIIITTIEAFSGIYLTLYAAHLLQKPKLLAWLCIKAGQASLFILIFHWYIQAKVFTTLTEHFYVGGRLSATLALALAVLLPMIAYWVTQKSRFLSLFYMPVKSIRSNKNDIPIPTNTQTQLFVAPSKSRHS